MKKTLTVLTLAISLLFAQTSAFAATSSIKPVVVYKGGTVSKSEFIAFEGINRLFNPYYDQIVSSDKTYRTKIAEQLVLLKVIAKKASKAQLGKLKKRVATEFATFQKEAIANFGNKSAYKKQLKTLHVQESDIKTYMTRSDFATDYFRSKLTKSQLQAKYKAMAKDNQFVVATVRHILIMTTDPSTGETKRTDKQALARAKELKKQLDQGADFAKLAKKYSEDPGSASNGGVYKDANVNSWVTEFKQAAIQQKINVIGAPVKTSYGYHIIRVEKRSNKAYSAVKSSVENELVQAAIQTYTTKTIKKKIQSIHLP
jgi:foldase protein PrsA